MKKVLQKDLDFKKWIESEKANRDLCSTYDFCKDCDKNINNPCEIAYAQFKKKNRKKVLSFEEKLNLAKDETKEKFESLIDEIKDLEIKTRICKKHVTLRYKKILLGVITLTKNSLKIHLNADFNKYEEIPHLDYSNKKTYVLYPFAIKLTTKKAVKSSLKILKEIK